MADFYATGTVDVVNGDATVTGSGTSWALAGVRAGDKITFVVGGVPVEYGVDEVTDATHLEITPPWGGSTASGLTYFIERRFDEEAAADTFRLVNSYLEQLAEAASIGQAGVKFTYDTTVTMADPGTGKVRFNNASLASATAAAISDLSAETDNPDVSAWVLSFDDASAAIKGSILVKKAGEPHNFVIFDVTALVDNSGWTQLALTHVDSGGTITNADDVRIEFYRAGDAGADGVRPGYRFTFSTTTTDSDPGAGKLRFNNGTFAAITQLFVDNADAVAADVTAWLDGLDNSTNATHKGYLRIEKHDDPAIYREFVVTGTVVDGTGYRKVPVSPVSQAGVLANDATVVAIFTATGNVGAGGADGDDGADGADGSDPGILLTFDTATADADPGGPGKIRANNASLASATLLYIDKANRAGSDIEALLLALDDPAGGSLWLTDPATGAQAFFSITSVADATGYVKVTVAYISGATSFANDLPVSLQWARAGNNGNDGANGSSALTQVRVVATTNVTIATALENGDTIDGVTLATNDLVLLAGQSAAAENGVYTVVASGAASRASGLDIWNSLTGAFFSVMEGSVNADTLWRCTSNPGGTLDTTALAFSRFGREALIANRTYYVRTDGSNSNNGLANTAGGAFLTLQKAMDLIAADLDLGPYVVTVQIGDGTYTAGLTLKSYMATSGYVVVQGNSGTPANVVVSTTSANAVGNASGARGFFILKDFKVQTTTSGRGLYINGPGMSVEFSGLDFGACAGTHCEVAYKAFVKATGAFAVSGNATVGFWATRGGLVFMSTQTITYSNSPVYSARNFNASEQGWVDCYSMTFTNGGTVTGKRYQADNLGGIFTNGGGASYVPGNSAGSTSAGAQYV